MVSCVVMYVGVSVFLCCPVCRIERFLVLSCMEELAVSCIVLYVGTGAFLCCPVCRSERFLVLSCM